MDVVKYKQYANSSSWINVITGGCFKEKAVLGRAVFNLQHYSLPVLVSILDLSDAVHESEMEMGELLKGLILKDRIHARWIFNDKAELCFRSLMLTWRLISAVHWREFAGARSTLCICARGCSWEHGCWLSAGRAGHSCPQGFALGVCGTASGTQKDAAGHIKNCNSATLQWNTATHEV